MNGKSLLVIGGTGFIGLNFIQEALKRDFTITNISLASDMTIKHKNLSHFKCNLLNLDALKEIISYKKFNYVVNFGTYINHSDFLSGGAKVLDVQVQGLINILLNINKESLVKFINIGSSDEYGINKSPQKENMIVKPFSPYSLGKVLATQFLEMAYKIEKIPTLTLRPFLVYGPHQKLDRFLPYIIQSCINNKSFDCSEGTQIRDFCYVGDFIEAVFLGLENNSINGDVLNIASGIPISIKEITLKVVNIIGKGNPNFGKFAIREDENMSLYADISKAKKLLKWMPQTSIEERLQKTINHYKSL